MRHSNQICSILLRPAHRLENSGELCYHSATYRIHNSRTNMKVILLQDVAKIGKKGEVAEVPNGYAMNSLIPTGKVAPATPATLKQASAKAAATQASAADAAATFTAALATLSSGITITATMNEQDHLFEAVSAEAVVEAAAAAGATISADMVQFAEPIKAAGEHTVTLVSGDQSGPVTLTVAKAE